MASRSAGPLRFLFGCAILISRLALAQVMTIPTSGFSDLGFQGAGGMQFGLGLTSQMQMINNLYGMNTNVQNRSLDEASSSSVSKLDLKAPGKARREYDKGYQLLQRKDLQAAIEHLLKSMEIYPQFVAAHNALGSAYLELGRNQEARDEFSKAATLDDHLPNSHLNLGVAQLALKDFAGAEESLKKASSLAPLDLGLRRALAYSEFAAKDYPAVIGTAQEVHKHKHDGSAVVHYFAAAAWEAQNNYSQAEKELDLVLREEPKSSVADQARQILEQLKAERAMREAMKQQPPPSVTFSFEAPKQPTADEAKRQAQQILQNLKQKSEIEEAEAAEAQRASQAPADMEAKVQPASAGKESAISGGVLRTSVDEVAVFFAATDHGKSVTDLTGSDVAIRDNEQAPAAILGFRNEASLPLRLGLVIDTSDSVSSRFSFEQGAAAEFLDKAVTGEDDLAFVVGVNNSVLLVQDFTADHAKMARGVSQLVPSGGTALWDAVAYAAEKLASYSDPKAVARVLVVISDGKDNSSEATLKEAIERAQHGEVAVCTVSTREYQDENPASALGNHALQTLSQQTGGAAFEPGSVHRLKGGLADIQQVLRGRYLVSYKPAGFHRDGRYRSIDISAAKSGHKYKVYARKGYYASAAQTASPTP